MNVLKQKLLKNSIIDLTSPLMESKIYTEKDMIPTEIPMINMLLSGKLDGGLTPGLTIIAGESKRFKSGFCLLLAGAYLKKYPDAMIYFYDSEGGIPEEYFDMMKVPKESVIHSPVFTLEMLESDLIRQLDNIERGEKVFFMLDSVGNLTTNKSIENALQKHEASDMGLRAKKLRAITRNVTGYLIARDLPMVMINHIYDKPGQNPHYAQKVVSGGQGIYLPADNIWIVSRRQEKEDDEIIGYDFIINVEKSRYSKEKSSVPITFIYDQGIEKWSGLFDIALEGGYIKSPSKGWYAIANTTGNFRKKDVKNSDSFWEGMFENTDIKKYIMKKYALHSE
jgi:RecA/RadA recombinase